MKAGLKDKSLITCICISERNDAAEKTCAPVMLAYVIRLEWKVNSANCGTITYLKSSSK